MVLNRTKKSSKRSRRSRPCPAFETCESRVLLAGDVTAAVQSARTDLAVAGDVNASGNVDFADFLILSNNYDTQVDPFTHGDIDGNGWVNFVDFLKLSNNFGHAIVSADPDLPNDPDVDPETPNDSDTSNIDSGSSSGLNVPITSSSEDLPRVVGAISTGNTSLVVTFNEPMAEGAEVAANYSIAQENVNSEAGTLTVLSAQFLGQDHSVVRLTTLSQNELTYRVQVVNVKDTSGTPLQPKEFVSGNLSLHDPTSATFAGTAPGSADESMDNDADGLLDNEEQRGRPITIKLTNGTEIVREVTSNPFEKDTDGDGLDDATEAAIGTDPRDSDTDDDLLPDEFEFNATFSDPSNQDTDGDGLDDGAEFNFFQTSPVLADTDGDQFSDAKEIVEVNRNPRSADLPLHSIEIGDISVSLDVLFTDGTRTGEEGKSQESTEHTLQSSNSREISTTDTETNKWLAKAGVKASVEVGFPDGVSASVEFTAEAGVEASGTYVQNKESKRESRDAHERSQTTNRTDFSATETTRTVTGATLVVPLDIKNAGDLTFSISDLELTALIPDPDNPAEFVPIGTLLPPTNTDAFTLGTIDSQRGPFRFTTSKDEVNPDLIESLLANPRGIIIEVSNFNLKDEDGNNFAFRQQDVTERTAPVVIDFGNGEVDRHWVAIGTGRQIDTDADGDVDAEDRRTIFDGAGKPVGVSLLEALDDVIGLKRIDLDQGEDLVKSDEVGRRGSYATRTIEKTLEDATTVPVLSIERIREVESNRDLNQGWVLLTSEGIDAFRSVDDVVLARNEGVTLAFVQDTDLDGVPRRIELIYGTSDEAKDTDGDGLDDPTELFEGYEVIVVNELPLTVFSDPTSADTDRDGLTDAEERLGFREPTDTELRIDGLEPTNAASIDTDGDGLCDGNGENGEIDCDVDEFPLDPNQVAPPTLPRYLFTNSGTTIVDDSGNNRDGSVGKTDCLVNIVDRFATPASAVYFAPPQLSGGAGCGAGAFSTVSLPPINTPESFSVSFWMLPGSPGDYDWVIGQTDGINASSAWFRFFSGSDPELGGQSAKLSFGIPSANGAANLVVTDPQGLTGDPDATVTLPEEWIHYVVSVDGSVPNRTTARLYRDGQEVATNSQDVTYTNPNANLAEDQQIGILIGNRDGRDTQDFGAYQGAFDDLEFFDEFLSAEDVDEIFRSGGFPPVQ